jgi:hypothetical protein
MLHHQQPTAGELIQGFSCFAHGIASKVETLRQSCCVHGLLILFVLIADCLQRLRLTVLQLCLHL